MSRTRLVVLTVACTLVATLVAGGVGAAAMIWGGLYDVAATKQHLQITYSAMEIAMRQSARLRARGITPPDDLDDDARLARGAACFAAKCAQCHGAPGVAPGDLGRSLQPLPGPLVDSGRELSSAELYWITRNGIKMTGMPAWRFRMDDEDLWSVVAFVRHLHTLRPDDYRAIVADLAAPECERRQDAAG
jgi:mono/diheme cytochrome c family protein